MKTMIKNAIAAGVMASVPFAAAAAEYPARAIELIVPAPAGGGTDTAARMLARLFESGLGQAVAVVNVAGEGGSAGVTQFMQARPDGYTLPATWNSPITTVPHVQRVAYRLDSYVPIVSTSETAYTFCVRPDFPADSGQEFLEVLGAEPNRYTYGNDGVGGTMQLAAERIFSAFGVSVRGIPFRGAGETLKNFLGGHVDIYGGSISPVLPHVAENNARCLIVTSADAIEALPRAGGLGELGKPELATGLWRAILGPRGMSADRVQRIADVVEKAVQQPEYVEFLASLGERPMILTGDTLRRKIEAEHDALAEVVARLGIQR